MPLEEQLIELVKEREFLYNSKSVDYKKKNLKEKAWNEIARELEIPVNKCKTKWRNFRDKFKKLSNRVVNGQTCGGGEIGEPFKWKYYNSLNFLSICDDPLDTNSEPPEQPMIVKVVYVDENGSVLPPTNSSQSTSPPTDIPPLKRAKKKDGECHKEFKSFLQQASSAIASIHHDAERKTSTTMLFETLAAKINEAELPRDVLNALEKSVADAVYNVIS